MGSGPRERYRQWHGQPLDEALIARMEGVGLFLPDVFLRWSIPGRACPADLWAWPILTATRSCVGV